MELYHQKDHKALPIDKKIERINSETSQEIKQLREKLDALEKNDQLTFGDRMADKVAEFGGSWRFIILFTIILVVWMIINSLQFLYKPFDPYPFILLNLVLSTIAALQAPVIMMSQNRSEDKDRERAKEDFYTNMKAEIELCSMHRKLDLLLQELHYLKEDGITGTGGDASHSPVPKPVKSPTPKN